MYASTVQGALLRAHRYTAKREFQWGDVGPVWYLFIFS